MTDDDLSRTAVHEAGHSTVAFIVGFRVGPVTIRPGRAYRGCAWSTPPKIPQRDLDRTALSAALLPARVRQTLERRVMVAMAGDLAAELIRPPTAAVRLGERVSEIAAERMAALVEPTREESYMIGRAAEAADLTSDAANTAEYARALHGGNVVAAGHHLRWLEEEAKALLARNAGKVEAVAAALLEYRSLSGRAVREILTGTRRAS